MTTITPLHVLRSQSFIIPGRPNCNHRPRHMNTVTATVEKVMKIGKGGRQYASRSELVVKVKADSIEFPDPAYKEYMDYVTICARASNLELYERARLIVKIYIPMNVTDFVKKQNVVSEPLDRSDVDNMKAIMDGLKGIAFADDKHVMAYGPYFVPHIPHSERFTEVTIEDIHWTDLISPEAREWCREHNVAIPETEDACSGGKRRTG